VAERPFRGRPGAAQYAQGATLGLDGEHAFGGPGTDADRRQLVGRRHSTLGHLTGASSTRVRSCTVSSATNTWNRWQARVIGEDTVYLLVRTCQSNIHIAQVARTRAFIDGQLLEVRRRAHRRTRTFGAGTQSRRQARRDAGAGEAGLFLYLARPRHFGVRAGGAQGDRACESL